MLIVILFLFSLFTSVFMSVGLLIFPKVNVFFLSSFSFLVLVIEKVTDLLDFNLLLSNVKVGAFVVSIFDFSSFAVLLILNNDILFSLVVFWVFIYIKCKGRLCVY